jgi:hypothetical protein
MVFPAHKGEGALSQKVSSSFDIVVRDGADAAIARVGCVIVDRTVYVGGRRDAGRCRRTAVPGHKPLMADVRQTE